MQNEKEFKKKKSAYVLIITASISALLFCAFHFLFQRYEAGIIDIYAQQQDSYVKLVVDQIEQSDSQNDQTAVDVLSMLDASGKQYWTFADDGSIVFLRNVQETGSYQSISLQRYFEEHGSPQYLESLHEGEVNHQVLELNHEKYAASGTVFKQGDKQYTLVLLTDVNYILENNVFLEAKTALYLLIVLILIAAFAINIINIVSYNRLYEYMMGEKKETGHLQDLLKRKIAKEEESRALDTRENIFPLSALKHALNEMSKQERTFPLSIMYYVYPDEAKRNEFLHDAGTWMKPQNILFDDTKKKLLIMTSMRTDAAKNEEMQKMKEKYGSVFFQVYTDSSQLESDLL